MIRVLGLLWDPLSSWVEVLGLIILFGLYYGFLSTSPFGPSKIYSMRSFFLGETIYGIIAISGSITWTINSLFVHVLFAHLCSVVETSRNNFISRTIYVLLFLSN
jgi:hypothetical protein